MHQLVREHLETFLARFEDDHSGRRLPRYVENELRGFLACGDPAYGFCRIHCPGCAADLLVPFSCKGRAFCPSCGGRRMAEVAAHLVDRVFPTAPIRQWVLSVPWALRLQMARNPSLCRAVARAFLRAVSAHYRRNARSQELLETTHNQPAHRSPRAQAGAVNFVQRFGSSLALNVHFHALFIDGAYLTTGPADRPRFHPAAPLTHEDVTRVQRDAMRRIGRVLRSRGDGKVKWSLRRPWRDGTRTFVFDPLTFLERLAALAPHPREHQFTYFGVLAPASPLRDAVVPAAPQTAREASADEPNPCPHSARRSWAELLKRTFGVDVLRCPRCGSRRRRVATITDPLVARKILAHLGLPSEPPSLAPPRPPPQGRFA